MASLTGDRRLGAGVLVTRPVGHVIHETQGRDVRADQEREYVEYVTARLPALHRIARLLCHDSHRAEDVVQTTITRLFIHWKRASAAENLDAYVHTMLVRTFLSERRLSWAKVRLFGAAQDIPHAPMSDETDVDTQEMVRTALSRVAPKQRAVLVLRFLCDLPVADVAAILGCSQGNVTGLTAHGLKRLRALLPDPSVAQMEGGGLRER